jgi:hypothetical protein
MGKNIAAGVAGTLVAVGLVWIIESAGHTIYPLPPGLDFTDTEAVRLYIAGLPLGAFLFVGGAWFLGTLGGTMAACYVGNAAPRIFAMIVGALMLAATAFNLAMIPHPLWFSVTGIAGIIFAAWLGMFIVNKANSR